MAKTRSLIKFSGTMDGKTFVDSVRYGEHVRSRRKSTWVNDTLRRNCNELNEAVPFAKLIKDNFNPYLDNLKDGTLWTRLCAVFRKQIRDGGQVSYLPLEGLQLHGNHSMHALVRGKIEFAAALEDERLRIKVNLNRHPYFRLRYINAYRITIVVVAISGDSRSSHTLEHGFPITQLKDKAIGEEVLYFPITKRMKSFVIAMKCEGCQDQDVMYNKNTTGMDVLRVVERKKIIRGTKVAK